MIHILKAALALGGVMFLMSCSSSSPSGPDSGTPVDSTLLGGIRKLTTGMYWIEFEIDTTVKVKDSANVRTITRDTVVHHKVTTVNSVTTIGNDLQYQLTTSDTIIPVTAAPTMSAMTLMHSATEIMYVMPPGAWLNDSIRVKAYDLPLATGKSWQSFNITGDTSMVVPINLLISAKLAVDYSYSGQVQVTGTTDYQFGGSNRSCSILATTTNSNAVIVSDSTLVITVLGITDTIVRKNDTVATSKTVETGSEYVNAELSIPLWSATVSAKLDTNYLNNVVERDTTRKGVHVTTYIGVIQ